MSSTCPLFIKMGRFLTLCPTQWKVLKNESLDRTPPVQARWLTLCAQMIPFLVSSCYWAKLPLPSTKGKRMLIWISLLLLCYVLPLSFVVFSGSGRYPPVLFLTGKDVASLRQASLSSRSWHFPMVWFLPTHMGTRGLTIFYFMVFSLAGVRVGR